MRTLDNCVSQLIDHRGKTPNKLGGDWSQQGVTALLTGMTASSLVIQCPELPANFVDDEMFSAVMPVPLSLNDFSFTATSEAPIGEMVYLAHATGQLQRVLHPRTATWSNFLPLPLSKSDTA